MTGYGSGWWVFEKMVSENNDELIRILIVDDSRLMRKSVSRILRNLNDVVEAEHGEAGWEMLQKDETIRIVCCDLSMPVMDGFGFLEKVRNSEDERIRAMPVIIVTGQEDSEENRNRIFEAGASDFVSKPFDSAQLKACIKTHSRLQKTTNALEKKESELEDVAAVDPLTGLGTRAFFTKSAEQAISFARRHDAELIFTHIQVDNMRELFLKVGKRTASALLKKIGEILMKNSRQEDMVCRMGLDGFSSLLRTCDLNGAVRMTDRVRDMVSSLKLQHGVNQQNATVSAAVVRIKVEENTTVDDVLRKLKAMLVQAQDQGGNKVIYNTEEVQECSGVDLTVEQALYLISQGEPEKVGGQLNKLIRRVTPLLGLYARQDQAGIKKLIEMLQKQIR